METFIVRVWKPTDNESMDNVLRGLVRRITTGVERPYRCDAELLAFLHSCTDGSSLLDEAAGVERPPDPKRRPPSKGGTSGARTRPGAVPIPARNRAGQESP